MIFNSFDFICFGEGVGFGLLDLFLILSNFLNGVVSYSESFFSLKFVLCFVFERLLKWMNIIRPIKVRLIHDGPMNSCKQIFWIDSNNLVGCITNYGGCTCIWESLRNLILDHSIGCLNQKVVAVRNHILRTG